LAEIAEQVALLESEDTLLNQIPIVSGLVDDWDQALQTHSSLVRMSERRLT